MKNLWGWSLLLWILLLFFPWWGLGRSFTATDLLAQTSTMYDPGVVIQNEDMLDNIFYQLPSLEYLSQSWQQGRIPLWNPLYLAGTPSAFNGQSGYLYPPRWLLAPAGAVTAYHLSLLIHLSLTAFFTYAWGRDRGLGRPAAHLLALSWALNGPVLAYLGLESPCLSQAWLSGCLFALGRTCRDPRWAPLAGLAVGVGVLGGHLNWTFLGLLTAFIWAARIHLKRTVVAAVLGGLLAFPILFPLASHLQSSQRPPREPEFFQQAQSQYLRGLAITLLYPEAYGSPREGYEVHRIEGYGSFIFPELCSFSGNVANLLALYLLLCFPAWRRPALAFLALLVVPATPLYVVLLKVLPPLAKLNPTRLGWLLSLGISYLAAWGLESAQQGLRPREARRVAWLGLLALVVVLGWQFWMQLSRSEVSAGWPARQGLLVPSPGRALSNPEFVRACQEGYERCFSWFNPCLWIHAGVLVSMSWALARARLSTLVKLAVVLTGAELCLFCWRFQPQTVGPALPPNPVVQALKGQIPGRIFGCSSVKPNQLLSEGIATLAGYDSFFPRETGRVLSYLDGAAPGDTGGQMHMAFLRKDSVWLDWLNATSFLALPGEKPPGGWRDQGRVGPFSIWSNPRARGRAFVVHEVVPSAAPEVVLQGLEQFPRRAWVDGVRQAVQGKGQGRVQIVEDEAESVQMEVELQGDPALLVLSQSLAPGWAVTVDGQPRPLLRANLMFPAVRLEAGRHQVRFFYVPPGWPWAWGAWLGALALSAGAWFSPRVPFTKG